MTNAPINHPGRRNARKRKAYPRRKVNTSKFDSSAQRDSMMCHGLRHTTTAASHATRLPNVARITYHTSGIVSTPAKSIGRRVLKADRPSVPINGIAA